MSPQGLTEESPLLNKQDEVENSEDIGRTATYKETIVNLMKLWSVTLCITLQNSLTNIIHTHFYVIYC